MKKSINITGSFFKLLLIPILSIGLITACGDDDDTVNGVEIEVIVDGGTVTVNGSAIVTTVDLEGTNGVIHLIDSVLIPDNL